MTLPSMAVETAIAQCTSRWAMARGHRLNTPIVLAAVHGLSGLFRAVSAVEPSLSRPLPPPPHPVPVPNKQPRFCGRKAIIMVTARHRGTVGRTSSFPGQGRPPISVTSILSAIGLGNQRHYTCCSISGGTEEVAHCLHVCTSGLGEVYSLNPSFSTSPFNFYFIYVFNFSHLQFCWVVFAR